jgi:hypothetical protein
MKLSSKYSISLSNSERDNMPYFLFLSKFSNFDIRLSIKTVDKDVRIVRLLRRPNKSQRIVVKVFSEVTCSINF